MNVRQRGRMVLSALAAALAWSAEPDVSPALPRPELAYPVRPMPLSAAIIAFSYRLSASSIRSMASATSGSEAISGSVIPLAAGNLL